ncbi:MAG: PAN domain-containing protein, partial [Actinomycetales bacterium]
SVATDAGVSQCTGFVVDSTNNVCYFFSRGTALTVGGGYVGVGDAFVHGRPMPPPLPPQPSPPPNSCIGDGYVVNEGVGLDIEGPELASFDAATQMDACCDACTSMASRRLQQALSSFDQWFGHEGSCFTVEAGGVPASYATRALALEACVAMGYHTCRGVYHSFDDGLYHTKTTCCYDQTCPQDGSIDCDHVDAIDFSPYCDRESNGITYFRPLHVDPSPSPPPSAPPGTPPPSPLTPPRSVCENTCNTNGNGVCEDGGADAPLGTCAIGTDCDDCGPRFQRPPPPPPPFSPITGDECRAIVVRDGRCILKANSHVTHYNNRSSAVIVYRKHPFDPPPSPPTSPPPPPSPDWAQETWPNWRCVNDFGLSGTTIAAPVISSRDRCIEECRKEPLCYHLAYDIDTQTCYMHGSGSAEISEVGFVRCIDPDAMGAATRGYLNVSATTLCTESVLAFEDHWKPHTNGRGTTDRRFVYAVSGAVEAELRVAPPRAPPPPLPPDPPPSPPPTWCLAKPGVLGRSWTSGPAVELDVDGNEYHAGMAVNNIYHRSSPYNDYARHDGASSDSYHTWSIEYGHEVPFVYVTFRNDVDGPGESGPFQVYLGTGLEDDERFVELCGVSLVATSAGQTVTVDCTGVDQTETQYRSLSIRSTSAGILAVAEIDVCNQDGIDPNDLIAGVHADQSLQTVTIDCFGSQASPWRSADELQGFRYYPSSGVTLTLLQDVDQITARRQLHRSAAVPAPNDPIGALECQDLCDQTFGCNAIAHTFGATVLLEDDVESVPRCRLMTMTDTAMPEGVTWTQDNALSFYWKTYPGLTFTTTGVLPPEGATVRVVSVDGYCGDQRTATAKVCGPFGLVGREFTLFGRTDTQAEGALGNASDFDADCRVSPTTTSSVTARLLRIDGGVGDRRQLRQEAPEQQEPTHALVLPHPMRRKLYRAPEVGGCSAATSSRTDCCQRYDASGSVADYPECVPNAASVASVACYTVGSIMASPPVDLGVCPQPNSDPSDGTPGPHVNWVPVAIQSP